MSKLGQKFFNVVLYGKLEELVQLLSGGVDPAVLSYQGKFSGSRYWMTALMVASYKGDTEMVNLLAKAGADVNHQSSDYPGRTALMWASGCGHIATVQALLQWRAQIDLQDPHGYTALMWAAYGGRVEIVRLLLDWGADKRIKNKLGKTAADRAKNEEIRAVINSHVFSGRTPHLPIPTSPVAESTTAKTKANTVKDAGADDPVLPSPAELAAAECAELQGECDTLGEQVVRAPARRDLMQRRDALQAQLDGTKGDFELISTLGESLEALKLEAAQLLLSEEDYLTLAARHAALVQRVEAKYQQLMEANLPVLLGSLADKLALLQEVNTTTLIRFKGPISEVPAVPHDPAKLLHLQSECTTFTEQIAQAPIRRELMQLAQELQAAKSAKPVDYKVVSKLMLRQNALEGQVQLSEEDYLTLAVRHAALVQRVQGMCEDLVAARQYRLLRDLAVRLTALRALDLTALLSPSEMDPVWVPPSGDPSASTAKAQDGTGAGTGAGTATPAATGLGGLEVHAEDPDSDPSVSDRVWVEAPNTISSSTAALAENRIASARDQAEKVVGITQSS